MWKCLKMNSCRAVSGGVLNWRRNPVEVIHMVGNRAQLSYTRSVKISSKMNGCSVIVGFHHHRKKTSDFMSALGTIQHFHHFHKSTKSTLFSDPLPHPPQKSTMKNVDMYINVFSCVLKSTPVITPSP